MAAVQDNREMRIYEFVSDLSTYTIVHVPLYIYTYTLHLFLSLTRRSKYMHFHYRAVFFIKNTYINAFTLSYTLNL